MVGFFNDRTSAPTFIFYESPTATFHPLQEGIDFLLRDAFLHSLQLAMPPLYTLYIVDLWQRHIMT